MHILKLPNKVQQKVLAAVLMKNLLLKPVFEVKCVVDDSDGYNTMQYNSPIAIQSDDGDDLSCEVCD